ncbi:CAF17-like 4Fe-4S cluster assembly/insertion protein YgfZ [Prosthecomicrobium sp. N25]|uniref:CAF17-like 4Fe-4S cluster assembly/insertion protein YgfZ n=1 Tax=Prosthecomicrobium sp. N25 TaxID=3129254 RepID=UPI0030770FE5
MTTNIAELTGRGVVSVTGPEAEPFLQGLVTADVEGLAPGAARYGALLTPQGKILFDFLAVRTPDGFLIDVPARLAADFAKRLRFYRLRAKVEIADRSGDLRVLAAWGDGPVDLPGFGFEDPRLPALGRRTIVTAAERDAVLAASDPGSHADEASWHRHRIALGVPEGGTDFAYGDAFPHDADMDDLAGVDFGKGCYVGQEVVSRMKHRGTARRRVVAARSADASPLPPTGSEIVAAGKPVGQIGSTDGGRGLALVRTDRVAAALAAGASLRAGDVDVVLELPAYVKFGWPAPAED